MRARRADFAADMTYVRKIIQVGNERANAIADQTLAEVRAAMGTTY
jgi:tryptophanyl-tRNA synthetase